MAPPAESLPARPGPDTGPGAPAPRPDRGVLSLALLALALVCLPLGLFPQAAGPVVLDLYDWTASNLGLLYQWFAIATILLLLWLAFGRYGRVRLGAEPPEFPTFHLVAMLFCSGVGAGLLFWSTIEWVSYYESPPLGVAPRSTEAIEWAAAYGLFHWGVGAWSLYALPTIAIAYPYYVKKVPFLRASTSCHSLLGPRGESGPLARCIDLLFVIALLGGAGTSLGFSAPMLAAAIAKAFGLEATVGLELAGVAFCAGLFGVSSYLGLERGMQRLSDLNVWLAFALVAYVLLVGPTTFLLRMGTDSIGFMFDRLIRMMTWTDPVERTGFVESWTIFYWAWWVAYGPFVGLFVTRISRGRTIREVILSMLCYGSLGGWAFFIALGDYALHLELHGILSVTGIVAGQGRAEAIAEVIGSLPLAGLSLAAFALLGIVFAATTYDSAAYALAASATARLRAGQHPARGHRLFWASVLGVLPALLIWVGSHQPGDPLRVVLSAALVSSFPLIFVGVAMAVALVRSLREERLVRQDADPWRGTGT